MSHLDPDQLALLAVGEPVASPEELAHLAACADCAAELAEMARTVSIARSTLGDAALETPPEHVWTAISAELGLAVRADAAPSAVTSTDPESAAADRLDESGQIRERSRPRRGTRMVWALAASFALIAAVGLGGWAVAARMAPTTIAAASLDAFPDHAAAVGSADVEEGRDGSRTLVVTLDGDDISDAYREVWLIRSDAAALISLGVLTGATGSFAIPDGLDLEEYNLVDISAEPVDGDPAHSGDSIVRGQLGAV